MSSLPQPLVQAKLRVGSVSDPLEGEADRAAELVMENAEPSAVSSWAGDGLVQRACAACEQTGTLCPQCAEDEPIRRQPGPADKATQHASGSDTAPELTPEAAAQIDGLRGQGQPLSASDRSFFEPRFQADFSQVRLHTGASAAEAASAIQARAFTVGPNIAFAANEARSASDKARRELLAHELAHVVQQGHAQRIPT